MEKQVQIIATVKKMTPEEIAFRLEQDRINNEALENNQDEEVTEENGGTTNE